MMDQEYLGHKQKCHDLKYNLSYDSINKVRWHDNTTFAEL